MMYQKSRESFSLTLRNTGSELIDIPLIRVSILTLDELLEPREAGTTPNLPSQYSKKDHKPEEYSASTRQLGMYSSICIALAPLNVTLGTV